MNCGFTSSFHLMSVWTWAYLWHDLYSSLFWHWDKLRLSCPAHVATGLIVISKNLFVLNIHAIPLGPQTYLLIPLWCYLINSWRVWNGSLPSFIFLTLKRYSSVRHKAFNHWDNHRGKTTATWSLQLSSQNQIMHLIANYSSWFQ